MLETPGLREPRVLLVLKVLKAIRETLVHKELRVQPV